MKIDISELKNNKNAAMEVCGNIKIDFEDERFEFVTPAEVNFIITNTGESILVEGNVAILIKAVCSRCLENFEYRLDVKIKEEFYSHIDKTLATILEDTCQEGNLYYNNFLEVDDIIRENLILQLPIKALCKEDCRGLCPKCGKNLNYEKCGCENIDIDPRWEILKKLREGGEGTL